MRAMEMADDKCKLVEQQYENEIEQREIQAQRELKEMQEKSEEALA